MIKYEKIDDHTLMEEKHLGGRETLRMVFNFQSRQMMILYKYSGYNSQGGVSMTTHNFRDLDGGEKYIAMLRQKLKELGGLPEAPKAQPSLGENKPEI